MAPNARQRISRVDVVVLIGFVGACYAVAVIGGLVTATSVETWYPTLAKPPYTPPDWLFAPVWTTLYGMMAIAAWRVAIARHRTRVAAPIAMFFIQLGLNLAWSVLFFGLRWIEAALVDIVLLLVLVAATTGLFWRVDRWAGLLFAPYVLWVGFATYLNAGIWYLN